MSLASSCAGDVCCAARPIGPGWSAHELSRGWATAAGAGPIPAAGPRHARTELVRWAILGGWHTLALVGIGGGAGASSAAGVVSTIGTSVEAAVVSSCPLMILRQQLGSGSNPARAAPLKRAHNSGSLQCQVGSRSRYCPSSGPSGDTQGRSLAVRVAPRTGDAPVGAPVRTNRRSSTIDGCAFHLDARLK